MERFFIKSFTVSEVTEELLLRKYSSVDYIMNKEYEDGYSFIKLAHEKEVEEKLWQQWLCLYQRMDKDNFISFNDFKKGFIPIGESTYENLSKEKILDKVNDIINLTLGGDM